MRRWGALPWEESTQCLPHGGSGIVASDQVVPDGQRGGLATVGHSELAEHAGDVTLDRPFAEEEVLGDLGIGQVLAEQDEDVLLAWTEDGLRYDGGGARAGSRDVRGWHREIDG